jgi:hypothetical protein
MLPSRPGTLSSTQLNSNLLDCLHGYCGISYDSLARTPQKTRATYQRVHWFVTSTRRGADYIENKAHLLLRVGPCLWSRCLAML